jgi:nicotinate dehydrogenase subunit A
MPEAIILKVNGREHRLEVDPRMPLLYALRNHLQLNAPRYGCGLAQCGNCMVLLDGEAEPSCMKPCSQAQGAEITTLEALGDQDSLHPLQEAFYETQAAQCGYCVNGMIMSAKALLDKNPNPSDQEIREGLQRVLCRCGTYSRFITAVKLAAEKINDSQKLMP